MHRTDATDNVNNQFAAGPPGTVVDAAWMNAVQEELCNLLEAMGVTLTKGTWTQIRDACVSAATASKIVRRDSNGRAQFADPSAAQDAATKNYVDNAITWSDGGLGANWSDPLVNVQYSKDRAGVVRLRGAAKAAAGAGQTIFTLPSGYRPTASKFFVIVDTTDTPTYATAILWLWDTGEVYLVASPTVNHSYWLDAVAFPV